MKIDESDITEWVGSELLKIKSTNNKMNFKAHDWRTYGFWAVVVVIGIVQALQARGINLGDVNVILGVLGFLEHFFAGQTSTNPNSDLSITN